MSETERVKNPVWFGVLGALACLSVAAASEYGLARVYDRPRPALIFRGEAGELAQRLQRAGARGGDVQVSLTWNNRNDLDLFLVDPAGDGIFLRDRRSDSGGELDVDMNARRPFSAEPVENIYWPTGRAPRGVYRVWVQYFGSHGDPDPTPYSIEVKALGAVHRFSGSISAGDPLQYAGAFPIGGVPFDPATIDKVGPWVPGDYTK
jgi:hypothetical protein